MKMTNTKRSATRHVPQRTCIACRQVKDKRELIRLVRAEGGIIEVDTVGNKAGRGAYLCRNEECWEAGCKGGRLEYSLRTSLNQDNRRQLLDWLRTAILEGDGEKTLRE